MPGEAEGRADLIRPVTPELVVPEQHPLRRIKPILEAALGTVRRAAHRARAGLDSARAAAQVDFVDRLARSLGIRPVTSHSSTSGRATTACSSGSWKRTTRRSAPSRSRSAGRPRRRPTSRVPSSPKSSLRRGSTASACSRRRRSAISGHALSGVTFTGGSVDDLARRAPEQGVVAPS